MRADDVSPCALQANVEFAFTCSLEFALFVEFADFARARHPPIRAAVLFQFFKQLDDAVRGFIEHNGSMLLGEQTQSLLATFFVW